MLCRTDGRRAAQTARAQSGGRAAAVTVAVATSGCGVWVHEAPPVERAVLAGRYTAAAYCTAHALR